jgi:hypothetical protein
MAYFKKYFFLFSCLFILSNQYLSSQEYYPLQVGNRWDYFFSHTEHPIIGPYKYDSVSIQIVKDTICSNGKRYFVMNRKDLANRNIIRYDPDSNSFYYNDQLCDTNEYQFFKLNSKILDRYETCGNIVTIDLSYITDVFGYNIISKKFYLDALVAHSVWLSDKFGIIKEYFDGEPPGTTYDTYELIGCIIDGKKYGRLLNVQDISEIPKKSNLLQNYPNPFNPNTTISYQISSETNNNYTHPKRNNNYVKLIIYDILGREVAKLVDEYKPAGNYKAEWNARNYPSGIYLYELITNGLIQTKKMILTK